jgi:predicted RNase H-like HicB family nuclease
MVVRIIVKTAAPGRLRAWCAGFPGCVVEAPTRAEVRRRITQAIEGYVASLDAATTLDFHEERPAEPEDVTG